MRVPDLKGLTEEAAEQALARRGLVGRMSVIRGRGPKGITGQRPDPGTLARAGTEVRYTVRR